jgi:hypothetical protein
MRARGQQNQVVGNAGMYFVAYRLSIEGWNVLPTSRNARGVDIVVYHQEAKTTKTIQVKTLSNRAPVPLGKQAEHLIADYIIVCVLTRPVPTCYVATTEEILQLEEIQKQLPNAKEKGLWAANSKPLWEDFSNRFKEKWQKIGKGN